MQTFIQEYPSIPDLNMVCIQKKKKNLHSDKVIIPGINPVCHLFPSKITKAAVLELHFQIKKKADSENVWNLLPVGIPANI